MRATPKISFFFPCRVPLYVLKVLLLCFEYTVEIIVLNILLD